MLLIQRRISQSLVIQSAAGQKKSRIHRHLAGVVSGVLLTLVYGTPTPVQATDKLDLSATLNQAPCTITMNPTSAKLEDTSAEAIWDSASTLQPNLTKVELTLSKCGLTQAGTEPVVTVTGKQATDNVKTANKYMFRDAGAAGGDSQQFFIAIANKAKPTTWSNTDLIAIGDDIKFTGVETSGEGAKKEIWLGVAAGDATRTDRTKARSGSVKATIELEMKYK
ncbi:hypothetical protein BFS14_14950 [Serratia fonticola]|uniref:hypothetical protein n=1 Tax=Serratia fonticola TaxID=47917 RepID=UPI0008FCED41|nr:hypothetical protein [Serratia fonticola]MBC3252325.1 hypothetical protein [Serratia fonticola]OIX95653.1 hypothetical protein BFS14_14950 [Serratia fonticola]QCR62165.1 hypothetical protein FD644_18230 [Serratia fonticola]